MSRNLSQPFRLFEEAEFAPNELIDAALYSEHKAEFAMLLQLGHLAIVAPDLYILISIPWQNKKRP